MGPDLDSKTVLRAPTTWQKANYHCFKAEIGSSPRGALDTVHGLPSRGCGDSSAEREFPSDNVYRRDNRGIVGVEPLIPHGLAFVVIQTSVGRTSAGARKPEWPAVHLVSSVGGTDYAKSTTTSTGWGGLAD